ncbi:MAG: DJ-1/PfpI family protein [Thermoleophilaceae bacterium]
MDIAIPLYDGFTALDAIGPYEVLSRLPGARVRFLADEPRAVRTDTEMLSLNAEGALADQPSPDVIVVPGGPQRRVPTGDEALLDWLRGAHRSSDWTTSVCTGALLLGAAGILDGLEASTHWLSADLLTGFGATPSSSRVVEQGKVVTAAGVSSGLDMALVLADRIAGPVVAQAIQLAIEYDPQPPFDSGSEEKAPDDVVQLVRAYRARETEPAATRP